MRFSLLLPLLLIGLLALAPQADAQRRAVSAAEGPTHSITLTYTKVEASATPLTLEIAPLARRARAPWGGDVKQVALLTDKGHIIMIDEFLSSLHQGDSGVRAEAMIPTDETVLIIFIRGERGPSVGWKIGEDRPSVREVDWTVIEYQDGDDFVARPQSIRTQGAEIASNALCNGIVDPWTGECIEEIRDPWGVRASDEAMKIEMDI